MCICVHLHSSEIAERFGWKTCLCVRVPFCVRVSLCLLVSISPGQGDTGINRDEPQIEEAVIEVFKKVRGD